MTSLPLYNREHMDDIAEQYQFNRGLICLGGRFYMHYTTLVNVTLEAKGLGIPLQEFN